MEGLEAGGSNPFGQNNGDGSLCQSSPKKTREGGMHGGEEDMEETLQEEELR